MKGTLLLFVMILIFSWTTSILTANEVTVGGGDQTGRVPVDMFYKCSLFQTLYFQNELNIINGSITGITFYNNFVTNLPAKPVKIWFGMTPLTDLSTSWVPSNQLTLVFDGTVNFPSGQNNITIPLSTPFHYTGGTLAMMMYRPMDTVYFSSSDIFLAQTIGTNRARAISSDSTPYDPAAPPATTNVSGKFPKTTFVYTPEYGYVIPHGGEYLPGAPGQNNTFPISWTISNASVASAHHVTLHYSTDGGTTYPFLIADNEPNDSTYVWTVPNISTNTARIRLQVKNSSNAVIDQYWSLGNFTIDTTPPTGTITITSPANGAWVNSTPLFTWSASNMTDVTSLGIIVDGSYLVKGLSPNVTSYQTLLSQALTSGWHTWTVRGLDIAGNWVQATQSWSIRVDATPPAAFSLNTPADDIWLATQSPTFVWGASMDNGSGLQKYQLYTNNTLRKDNIAPTLTQWTAFSGGFSDDAESGLSNWNTTGTWGLTTSYPHSGSYCITDSPVGNYANNQNSAITLAQPVALQSATSLSLSFWYRCDLESWIGSYDDLYLEISNNGTSWTQLSRYRSSNNTTIWTNASFDLNAYVSWTNIYLRFRIATNSSGTADGFYFDDLVLTANGIELTDGNYQWVVKAVDTVGNVQPSTNIRTLHIDTTAPYGSPDAFANLTPANNVWSADSLITFTWTPCVDDGIGLNRYELWIDGANVSGNITETHYQLLPSQVLQNGNHNWYVKVYDDLGNYTSTTQRTIRIDRIPPADFALVTPANGSFFIMPTPTFTWSATTDAGCGLSHYELWIDNLLNIDNISNTQTSTAPAVQLSEGSHIWKVFAVDSLGNRKQSTAVWTTIGDWNPPTQPILISPINNQIVSVSRPTMTWQKSTDAGTGVHHYILYINQLTPLTVTPADINAPIVSYQVPSTHALANGSHSWYVKAFDNAEGQSSSIYGAFVVDVDTTPPTSSITNPISNQYIGGESYLITGTASDNTGGSGVQKVEIRFNGGTWFLANSTGRSGTINESQKSDTALSLGKSINLQRAGNKDNLRANTVSKPSQDGDRDVYNWQYIWTGYQTGSVTIETRATDMNNNVETPPYSRPVIVEKIAPVVQSLNANPSYAKAGTVTFTMVFQTGAHCGGMNTSVTPTVTITPAGGTSRAVTQTSYQGNTWTGQTTIAQSDLNGTAVIRVSNAKDNINNQMALNSTYTFVIDTAAPNAFNLITPVTGAWMNVSQPQLTWGAATDVTSGIDHYALEIDGSTNSPGYNNIPATTTTIQPATALTMGTHNWRIRAYDRAGNSTWSSSFSFGLDLTPPVSAIVAPTNNSTIGGLAYTISGTSSDGSGTSSSGIANVQIRINSGAWLNVVNTGTNYSTWTYAWTGYTSGTYTIQSRSTDNAGNVETSPLTTTVTVNLNPPTVQTITITPNPAKVGVVNCTVVFTSNSGGLNLAVHPTVWFTTPNATVVNFTETSYSGNQWVGTASVLSTTQNGTATVHVTGAKDNYNNTMAPNQNAGTFVVDTVAPTVTSIVVNPQITNIRTDLAVQVNFTELTAGLNTNISPIVTIIPLGASSSGYIIVTQTGYNATTRVWTGVASITATTPEGLAAIKVASAADLAGNVMQIVTLQNQFTIDRSIPTAFNIIQPVTGSWTSNRQPLVSWSPSSDAISGLSAYKLEINGDQVGGNIAPTATSTTVQTMLPDGGYSLRVAAHDNAQSPNVRLSGTGPVILNIDGTAPTSVITAPSTGFVVTGNSVTVSGNASDGIGASLGIGVKYVLLSKNGGAVWDTVYVAPSQTQGSVTWNKTYTALAPGNYTIALKAIDWLNNMELSTSSISISVQETAPLAPSSLSATPASSSQINLSWTDSSNNESGFKIERKTGPTGNYAEIGTVVANVTTYQNTGLLANTQYVFRVRAYNADWDSGYSNEANATTPGPPQAPVAIIATNITQIAFQANWNAVTSAASYKLDISISNSFGTFVTGYNNLTVNGTNQTVTGLTAGTTYYYRVRAVNANGVSGNSNVITTLTLPPNPVAIEATSITNTSFQANWNAATSATSYKMDVSISNSFGTFVTGYNNLTVNGINQSVTGLTAGTTYYYRVRAVNANGISGNSNTQSVITSEPPQAPVATDATNITQTGLQANWNASTSATSYRLDVSTNSGFSSFVTGYNDLTVNGTIHTVTGLTAGTTYYYRARAFNANGTSGNSNVITTLTVPPNPVAIEATDITNTSFQANWNAATSATSYKLDVSISNSFGTFVTGYNNLTVNGMNQSVTGLTAGTTYYYRVRAVNANGISGNSNTQSVITSGPPQAPVAIDATNISQTGLQANWNALTGATSYKLDVSISNSFGTFVAGYNNLTVNSTNQSVTGLTAGMTYYYRVRAVNANGTSGNSNVITTLTLPPNPVAIEATSITNTSFQANWNAATSATSYKLDVSISNSFGTFVTGYNNLTVNGINQSVTGLIQGTPYFYRVRAVNTSGASGNSNTQSVTTSEPPQAPVATDAANITQTGFQANWNASTGATSYRLDVSTNSGFSSFVTGYNDLTVNGTNHTVTGLTAGTTYYYRARAFNANGTSGNSNVITALTLPPNPVAIEATDITNTSFQANWNAATSATSYKLDVSISNSFGTFVTGYNNLTVNGMNQSVTGLTAGTTYYYRVRAVNANGISGNSNTQSVITSGPPQAPVATDATNITQSAFQANWNSSTGATSYRLDVSTNSGFSSFVTGYNDLTVNGTIHAVTGLTAGTTYYYRTRAFNANGTSGNSNIIEALTVPPNPVAIDATSTTNTSFQANWNAATSATSYKLDVSISNSFGTFVTGYNNLTVNGINQSVTGLTAGTTYYYRVRAVNANGISGNSNTQSVITSEPPQAPVATDATNITQTGLQANWNASTSATSYRLDVSTNSGFSSFVTGYNDLTVNGTNHTVTGLMAGTTYYYRARAFNANGTSGNSNVIEALTVPSNPVAIDATNITQSAFQANWNAATSATSYKLDVSISNSFGTFVTGYNNLTVNGMNQSVTGLTAGTQYYYRVRAVNASGESGNSNIVEVTMPVSNDDPNNVPVVTELTGNYPNPFNPTTSINFSLNHPQKVIIEVYDIAGRKVINLVNETRNKGAYTVVWNGNNNSGNQVASGVYIISMKADNYYVTRKITLMK